MRGRILGDDLKDPKTRNVIVNLIAPAVKVYIVSGAMLLARGLLLFDNLSEDDVQLIHQE